MTVGGPSSRLEWQAGRLAAVIVALACTIATALALNFPPLSGRVVDLANIISADTRAAIEIKLAALESKSTIQLVVATVKTLEGQEIEPYANQLFRTWGLGQKDKNNGVLLLVAPNERRVHIEVGYGLEGTLTDALSKIIITNAITPRFKTGDFSGGIARGIDDIITVLTTDSSEWQQPRPAVRLDYQPTDTQINWLIALLVIAIITGMIISPGFRWFMLNVVIDILLSAPSSGSGSSSGGGGFSGGGGSSGGGGASGSW
jgi:uncharacterized protein